MSAPVKLTGEERSALAALSVEAYTFVAFAREQVKRSLAKKGLIVRGRGLSLTDAGRATLAALAASKGRREVSAWMLAAILAYAVVEVACTPMLNPDPRGGGACHNGDQLATACHDGSCCPDGYECDTDGHGCSPLPVGTVWLERRDAGGR